MKKRIFFKFILAIILSVFILPLCFFVNTTRVDADNENEQQLIVKTLNSDISFAQQTVDFDEFNGNGFSVVGNEDEGVFVTQPFFDSLKNVKVTNIKFKNIKFMLQSPTGGILANTIENSEIIGIEFDSCTFVISVTDEVPSLISAGLIAGKIERNNKDKKTIIDQISFKNCSIQDFQEDPMLTDGPTIDVNTNINVGFIAGTIQSGVIISNSIIVQSTVNLKFSNELAPNVNVGGLVGLMNSGVIINCIVDLYNSSSIKFDTIVEKTVNFGGLVGKIDISNKVEIYNNICCLSDNTVSYPTETDNFSCVYGAMVGILDVSLENSQIEGIIKTTNANLIGNKPDSSNFRKINNKQRSELNSSIFKEELWKEEGVKQWDFENIWLENNSATNNPPTLQMFNLFKVSFSTKNSLNSLKLENIPTVEGGSVVEGYINDSAEEITDIKYGTNVIVKAKITSEKKFDKFFSISGLKIDSPYKDSSKDPSLTFNIGDESSNIKLLNLIDQETGEIILNDGFVEFEVSNFVASYSGEYSVILTKNEFDINIKVLELVDENQNKVIPGIVKGQQGAGLPVIDNIKLRYGEKYSYETDTTNYDYSEMAYWFLVDENSESFVLEDFDYKNEITQFEQTNKLSWTFNENSILFNSNNGAMVYDLEKDDAKYTLLVAFPQTVRTIEIAFKDAEGENIKEKIAEISIDGETSRIVWDETKYVYVAKVPYNTKDHVIKIESWLDVNYKFIAWYEGVNTVLAVEMEGTETGVFHVSTSNNMEEDLEEILNLHCRVNKQKKGGSMLWLWITLACVGFALVIVVIVIIIKKRRGGGNSTKYKKQFYY